MSTTARTPEATPGRDQRHYGHEHVRQSRAVYNEFRRPRARDSTPSSGGSGVIRGFGFWNLDATVSKEFRVRDRTDRATLTFQFVNVLNHFVPADPTTN